MFKERRRQGIFPYVLTGVILTLLGLGFLAYYLTHFGANRLYRQGQILSAKVEDGNVVSQIIYIHPKSIPMEKRGTNLYLVGYADQDKQIGYIGLEAGRHDGLIRRLYEHNDELIEEPERIEVVVLDVADHFKQGEFATLAQQMVTSDSALGQEMDKVRMASLSLAKSNRNRYYGLTLLILGGAGFVFLLAWLIVKKQDKALRTFFETYPELDDSLDKAMAYASFSLPAYDVLVYQNHFLTYGRDIRLLDLNQLLVLKQAEKTITSGLVRLPIIHIQTKEMPKPRPIYLKKRDKMDLDPLLVYLNRYFAHIETNPISVDLDELEE